MKIIVKQMLVNQESNIKLRRFAHSYMELLQELLKKHEIVEKRR